MPKGPLRKLLGERPTFILDKPILEDSSNVAFSIRINHEKPPRGADRFKEEMERKFDTFDVGGEVLVTEGFMLVDFYENQIIDWGLIEGIKRKYELADVSYDIAFISTK